MPFDTAVKTAMFIRCNRHCCLCRKQCGINIEAAHIIDEGAGGSNDEDNGIPLCFDCHQEIGSYNDKIITTPAELWNSEVGDFDMTIQPRSTRRRLSCSSSGIVPQPTVPHQTRVTAGWHCRLNSCATGLPVRADDTLSITKRPQALTPCAWRRLLAPPKPTA